MNSFQGFTELDQLDFQMAQGEFQTEDERREFEEWLDSLSREEDESGS